MEFARAGYERPCRRSPPPELSRERRQAILRRGSVGLIPYVLASALAFVSAYATLAICAGVALYYASALGSGGES